MNGKKEIFENLFVLEMANNHWGDVQRGLKIIREHGTVARYNNIKAALKLQFRDNDEFIHPEYKGTNEIRYIKKTEATQMLREQYGILVKEIRQVGCLPMATPFDEKSVDLCVEFDFPIIKLASSDVNDWPLIEKIASTKLPVIVSSGGASEKDMDDIVVFFERRNIPLAINHCVSLYPSENSELELNQIDYFKQRYPNHVIGLSTHEYKNWEASMYISYGKGARTWERHIDIDDGGISVSPYCSLPEQVDTWFKAFNLAKEMSGGSGNQRRICSKKEIEYLDALVRGVCAKKDLEADYVFSNEKFGQDFYLAIPLHKGQLSCREVLNGLKLTRSLQANEKVMIDCVDGPYSSNISLKKQIENRGL